MKRKLYLIACTVLSRTAIGSAYATNAMVNDALAVQTARITLTQAVTAAEQHVSGKASRAEFEKHDDQWFFDVEVVSGKKVMDVKVDPESGKVLAATEDTPDRDEKHEKNEEHEKEE